MLSNLNVFRKLWAAQGPKVTITDAELAQGWGYLGQRPPEVEEFNYVQNLVDEKLLYLFELTFHWEPNKSYAQGDIATSKKLDYLCYLECTQAGTSSGTEPDWTQAALGDTVEDNTARWVLKSIAADINAAKTAATAAANTYTDTEIANVEAELEKHKADNIAYLNMLAQEVMQNKRGIENTLWEIGQVTLTNTLQYPFNNSQVTINLKKPRNTLDYIVYVEYGGNNVGEVIVSGKQINGFKLEYTGSASSVAVKYYVRGGMQ